MKNVNLMYARTINGPDKPQWIELFTIKHTTHP